MIFVDTNVFMYAVGRPHALQKSAQDFFIEANRSSTPLCTSAEVMQELAHVYLPTRRLQAFDATLAGTGRQCHQSGPCRGTGRTAATLRGSPRRCQERVCGAIPG